MQWRGHHPRGQDVLDCDSVMELGQGIERSVPPYGDRDLGQLFASGAKLVHVALRHQGVVTDGGRAITALELLRWVKASPATCADGEAVRRRGTPIEDQRHVAITGGNSGGSVAGMGNER